MPTSVPGSAGALATLGCVPGPIQSVQRAAALLQLVAEHPGELGLSELAVALGLAKATTHGLLSTLRQVGFLDQQASTGKYLLGPGLVELAGSHLDPHDLRSHAVNWADSLAMRSGEAVRLAALVDSETVVIHHVFRPDDSLQKLDTGTTLPTHATALGKVLLAWGVVLRPRGRLERYTRHTVTASRELARSLVEVRRRGWAADIEERVPGQASIAAPVHGVIGRLVGAIGISGPVDRLCDSRGNPRPHLVEQVRDAAVAVSRDVVTARR